MQALSEYLLHCPYCGEPITVLIDASIAEQEYIEDCEVCCRPIRLWVSTADGAVAVHPFHENE